MGDEKFGLLSVRRLEAVSQESREMLSMKTGEIQSGDGGKPRDGPQRHVI